MIALTGFVGELSEFIHDASSIINRHASIHDDQSIVAFDHRDVGGAESNGDVDFVGYFDDLFFKLF